MAVNSNALWDSSLRLIKENVEEQQYNTWFKPLVFESYNADTKTLLLQVFPGYAADTLTPAS